MHIISNKHFFSSKKLVIVSYILLNKEIEILIFTKVFYTEVLLHTFHNCILNVLDFFFF